MPRLIAAGVSLYFPNIVISYWAVEIIGVLFYRDESWLANFDHPDGVYPLHLN